ncbi:3-dehydroquinate synthase, chloroplastic-like [Wolffia australiana]
MVNHDDGLTTNGARSHPNDTLNRDMKDTLYPSGAQMTTNIDERSIVPGSRRAHELTLPSSKSQGSRRSSLTGKPLKSKIDCLKQTVINFVFNSRKIVKWKIDCLEQVDSSVGGKTGINHPLGKNLIGAFYQPQSVLIDTDTLNTLPDRELASGIAEVVKYGLIRDAEFFEWQEKNMQKLLTRDPDALVYAIKRSCENKAEVVSMDEKESGLRATLNLGHTFGHAIETGLGYGEWLHGKAVAAGIMFFSQVMAVDMSHRLGWVDETPIKRVINILKAARLSLKPPELMTVDMFRAFMAVDKKVADGLLRLILLRGPLGNCIFTGDYDKVALDETLRAFSQP